MAGGLGPTHVDLTALCGEVARLLAGRWGRGPRRCHGYWSGSDALLFLLEDGFTPAERSLAANGHAALVEQGRRAMYDVIEAELSRLVAQATGREVSVMLTADRVDPSVGALVFVLD